MLPPSTVMSLCFYSELQRLDLDQPLVQQSFSFARAYADLTRRVQAVQAARSGRDVEYPPGLELAALQAYQAEGSALSAERFAASLPDAIATGEKQRLGAIAHWYAHIHSDADPIAGSFQVWADPAEAALVTITGPVADPPPPLRYAASPPSEHWLQSQSHRPVVVIAHYDVHGLAMLALTLRYLRQLGIEDIDCIMSFELTGDVSKLWKRTVPRAITSDREYAAVILIDCSVHSRKPEYTLKAVSRLDNANDCRLIIIDHHDDTALLAPELMHPALHLALTDIPSCGLSTTYHQHSVDRRLAMLGALGDKDAHIAESYSLIDSELAHASTEYHRRMIHFSPTPKHYKDNNEMPLAPLWEALVAGEAPSPMLATETLGELQASAEQPLPQYDTCGGIVFTTERISSVGRTWYALLEKLMEKTDCSYAIAMRILDGNRANMLMLTHWRATHMPPIRLFIPEEYWSRCLGHYSAVWLDVEQHQALDVIGATTRELNRFLDVDADFAPIGEALKANILTSP